MVMLFKTTKVEHTTPQEAKQATEDPYVVLSREIPVLRNLTKATFTKYTSLLAAAARAAEGKKPDALLHDNLAEALAGEAGIAFTQYFHSTIEDPETVGYCILRHLMIDEEIEKNLSPEIQQVVMIGAGMDSRSYRLQALANCHVFELDAAGDLAEHKAKVLKELDAKLIPKAHDVVLTDFSKYTWPDELVSHGFDPTKPTLWIAEAVLMYLDEVSVDRLMETIDRLSAPKSKALLEMCGTGQAKMDIVLDDSDLAWHADLTDNKHQGGVLRALPWKIEMLLHRSAEGEYTGRRWDPVRFAKYHIPKDEVTIGPWFVSCCTKPAAP